MQDDLRTFWEDRYENVTTPTSGNPSAVLERYATGRRPGRALDIGCARGDDSLWLAQRGWQVTGIDVSEAALGICTARAEDRGLTAQTSFERHTLPETFPKGEFDLVSALFFQSPMEFDRAKSLTLAARAVAPGGLLIIASHKSGPPWGKGPAKPHFPTLAEERAAVDAAGYQWMRVCEDVVARAMSGPEGQSAEVEDNLVVLERVRAL